MGIGQFFLVPTQAPILQLGAVTFPIGGEYQPNPLLRELEQQAREEPAELAVSLTEGGSHAIIGLLTIPGCWRLLVDLISFGRYKGVGDAIRDGIRMADSQERCSTEDVQAFPAH